jgi:ammonium transporter
LDTFDSIDVLWVLISAALVMFMQAGFSALESGLVRSKNSINVAAKNFTDFVISSTIFWLFGFALMFGASGGSLLGWGGFAYDAAETSQQGAFFIFQLGFAGTAATIVSGAVAERMRFAGYIVITVIMATLTYPVVGHWAWGGIGGGPEGWLEDLGFVDFAGSTVVHSVGGWAALAAILVLGPRIGRFGPGAVRIHGHDLPLVTVGVFILWVGWFGFNGGSTLALDESVPAIIVNTSIAAALGGVAALFVSWFHHERPEIETTMNGALAGLVGITASAHAVTTPEAAVIGVVSAIIMFLVTQLLERLEIDDAVGAVPVHLGAGVWGTMAVAVFGSTEVLDTGLSRLEQLGVQALGVSVIAAWTFGVMYGVMKMLDQRLVQFRIDPEGESAGLNVAEHGSSTEILDLLIDMDEQRRSADYSRPVRVEPHTEVGQIAAQYNVVLEEINAETARRQAVAAALEDKAASLALLEGIAAGTNDAETLTEAITIALREVCKFTGWPVGHLYRVEQTSRALVPTQTWYISDPETFADFRALSESSRFEIGEGLPGLVLETGRPQTIRMPAADARFPQSAAASDAGIRAGFAFPITAGADIVGVLEFFSDQSSDLAPQMLDLMAVVGTQLGRAFERRHATEERFRAVVDNMPAVVFLKDAESRFIFVNRHYEDRYGFTLDELVGRTPLDVPEKSGGFLARELVIERDREVIEAGRALEYEVDLPSGEVLASVQFPILNPVGRVVAVGGVELDITDRKKHEAELAALVAQVESARDEALGATRAKTQFLANMSHELRTPLNAIIGFTRIVRRKAPPDMAQQQVENLDRILLSAESLLSLINDILDLSRVEAGRVEVLPSLLDPGKVAQEVASTVSPLAGDKGLSLMIDTDNAPADAFQDGEKVSQILLNLVGNAIKFTPQGSVSLTAGGDDDELVFDVVDTGVGIKAEALENIFEEFTQADGSTTRTFGGSGLGLTISARLAKLLGGRIDVESEIGRGSRFSLRLPRRYTNTSSGEETQ